MEKIQIKCTSCGQKFAVSESYKNRMVECGACDHRFKVEGAALIRQKKKYYPGERASVNADSFAKVESDSIPSQSQQTNELGFQPAQYENHPTDFTPPLGTKRTFMVILGVALLILFLLIFFLGSRPNGILQNVDEQKRILLAGFITLLSAGLIIGADRRKLRAILTVLILGGGLCAMPFLIPVEQTPIIVDGASIDSQPDDKPEEKMQEEYTKKLEAYKDGIGYRKVVAERNKVKNPEKVKAIVVRDIGSHTDTICNYFKYELGLDIAPTSYTSNRQLDNRRVSLILLESDLSTDEIREMTKKFGIPAEMSKLHRELDVVEVLVNENLLKNANTKQITDQANPNFFAANYSELSNISRDKQLDAIRRLARVKGSLGLRADIATKLASMITLKDHDKSNEAINALKLWALPEYKLDDKVKSYAAILANRGNLEIPVMEYLIHKKVPGISDILAVQWLNSNGHIVWDDLIKQAGSQGEEALIKALPKADSAHLKAACSALMRIGTKRSIPALTSALKGASKEDAKYLKTTIDEIQSRR